MSEVRSPTLETERLVLRALEPDDAEFIHGHFSDPQVTRYLLDTPPLTERSQAEELISFYATREGDGPNRWCLVRKDDGRAIGTCGFHCHAPAHRRAEIGYDLSPDAWGQGLMSEGLAVALTHGFEAMGLHRIEALVLEENERSLRLLERLGFQAEGTLRDYFRFGGVFHDHRMYSLLA